MEVKQEFLNEVKDEAGHLLELHWQEIAVNKDKIKLNPDWEAYEELEQSGSLKIFTARDKGNLVGYFVVIVSRSLHYKDHLFATNDIVFLHPEYRKGLTAIKLFKFAEKCLKEDGVSLMIINSKTHKPFNTLLERYGYNTTETTLTKYIGNQ
jgi:GNAT superfamily N-acetyltransferase